MLPCKISQGILLVADFRVTVLLHRKFKGRTLTSNCCININKFKTMNPPSLLGTYDSWLSMAANLHSLLLTASSLCLCISLCLLITFHPALGFVFAYLRAAGSVSHPLWLLFGLDLVLSQPLFMTPLLFLHCTVVHINHSDGCIHLMHLILQSGGWGVHNRTQENKVVLE